MSRNALAAGRSHLTLVREDHDRRVTEAVREWDQKITTPSPDTYVSPVRVGVLERKPDYCDGQRTAFVYLPVGGPTNAITVGLPVRGIDREVERLICELIEAIEGNLQPAPADD